LRIVDGQRRFVSNGLHFFSLISDDGMEVAILRVQGIAFPPPARGENLKK
jgi:hypothetical protein